MVIGKELLCLGESSLPFLPHCANATAAPVRASANESLHGFFGDDFKQSETSCAAKGEILEQMRKLQSTAKPVKRHGQTVSQYFVNRERQKRQTVSGGMFCQVFVAADHLFLRDVGGGDPASAISEIATIMSQVDIDRLWIDRYVDFRFLDV